MTGLRERKKAAIRQAVHETALRLAVERGIDNVTIDEIAEAAGISRRSFSNYFTGKEDALIHPDGQQIRAIVDAVRARPPGEPAWAAMRAVIRGIVRDDEQIVQGWAIRTRLALQHPAILAVQLGKHAALERDLAGVVAERDDVDAVQAQVLATAFLAGLRIALRRWIQEELTAHPADIIERVLDEMEKPFT